MRRAGVDIEEQAPIDAYLAAKSALAREPAAARERAHHRWRPAPGERAPDATAPCPCGSGRRYEKCRMPR